ncbi:DUF418 domain-containing protein [Streptomyces sp. V4-01]|uniref:DUF418 domain-containing protein n=1 Tax=Actinacidiphila polyblastidii TaxID=3110430 RepID=A0ABU7PFA1_9ACTN|nr:DUF418 domain-containing protein [Streptomyces sp. V4-01]
MGGRLAEIDVLRGFGLLGVAICNGQLIAGVAWAGSAAGPVHELDRATVWAVDLFLAAKFFPLMAFLLGYSYRLQAADPRYGGPGFHRRQGRRLCGLLLLGAANAVLLFAGDILTTYAVLGLLVLLALERMSPRGCLLMAGVCVALVTAEVSAGAFLTAGAVGHVPVGARSTIVALYRDGPLTALAARLRELPVEAKGDFVMAPDVLAALLAGLAAGQTRFLDKELPHRFAARGAGWVCLGVGLTGSVVATVFQHMDPADGRPLAGLAVEVATAPALTAAYALGLLALMRAGRCGPVLRAFAAAGRMSLTNYLGQSLLLDIVYTGYGLRLYGRVGAAAAAGAALAVYVLGLWASTALVRRGRHGPAEVFLRRLTNGALRPMTPGAR